MLTGVFHLHEQQARQVMTPAPAVVTVDTSEDVETALRRCVSSGHTRLVVTEDENRDRVKGIVHSNQLAQLLLAEGPQATLDGLVREVPIVPETKPLDDLLADLQRQRSSLAVVIDEYGRTAGHRHRRGHHRGGRRRDRRRDRPAGRRGPKTGQRRLVRARPRRDHRPDRLRARAAGGLRRLQLASAASSSASWGGCPSAATRSRTTAIRSAWSPFARTGSRPFASASGTVRRLIRRSSPKTKLRDELHIGV